MKALVRFVAAIIVVFALVVVIVGPGRLVAGAEYPMGVGPWGTTGKYCQAMYSITRLVEHWHASDLGATTEQESAFSALRRTLTTTGPVVPRADFVQFFRPPGDATTSAGSETALLNRWWDQNCTATWMEAPSSLNRVWTGVIGHVHFTHYPKNVIVLEDFARIEAH